MTTRHVGLHRTYRNLAEAAARCKPGDTLVLHDGDHTLPPGGFPPGVALTTVGSNVRLTGVELDLDDLSERLDHPSREGLHHPLLAASMVVKATS